MRAYHYLLSLLLTLITINAHAQLNYAPPEDTGVDSTGNIWDRLSFGGSASMSQQDPTRVSLSPSVEYKVSDLFSSGLNANLTFTQGADFQGMDHGLGLYGRLTPSKGLPFLQLEYQMESTSIDSMGAENRSSSRDLRSSLMFGGGLEIEVHEKLTLRATAMYNMTGGTTNSGTPVAGQQQMGTIGRWSFRIGVMSPLSFVNDPPKKKDLDGWISSMKETPFSPGMLPIPNIMKKLDVEGNVSMSLGDPSTIDFSPMISVEIDSNFSAGIGPSIRMKADLGGNSLEGLSIDRRMDYGGRAYLRYQYNKYVPFLQMEYEGIYGQGDSLSWGEGNRKWVSSVLVGIGHKIKIKKVGEFGVTALRNLSYRGVTPVHNSPWTVRTSFKKDLPFDDVPIPGTFAPKKKGFRLSDLFKLEGNLGLSLGELTQIDFSPALAHEFNEHMSLGAGPIVKYRNDKRVDVSSTLYGGRMYARLTPEKNYPFLQIEGEGMNISGAAPLQGAVAQGPSGHNLTDLGQRTWQYALLIGGGVQFPIGSKHSFNISALRDVTYKGRTPVRNEPWEIRMGLRI